MFRKEFVEVITKTGMVPIKDLRPLIIDKDSLVISELGILQFKFFDDVKFAKQLSENYNITYINGALTIQKATLTAIGANVAKTYGTENPALPYNISGFIAANRESCEAQI